MGRGPMGPLEQKCCNSEVRSEGGRACPKGLWAKSDDKIWLSYLGDATAI